MSSSAATAAAGHDGKVASDEVKSANDNKRKAEERGGPGDMEESKQISDEDEERSIEQLAWEDLWSDDFETVEKATEELEKLTFDEGDDPDVQANCNRVVETSGHVIILKNVEKSMGDQGRHEFIDANLRILANLCYRSAERGNIICKTPKVIDTTSKIMHIFADHPGCCATACFVLGKLAINDDDMKVKLLEGGVIPLAIECMKRFVNNKDMQRFGCYLLLTLLTSEKGIKSIVDAANACKALTVLSEAKYNFCDDHDIVEMATAGIMVLLDLHFATAYA